MTDYNTNQSPDFAKISSATAMSLGLSEGRFYRNAKNRCANLLVHYREGCAANCAYCGLNKQRTGSWDKTFIMVQWPIFSMDTIVKAINASPKYVKRTCISMITNGRPQRDTIVMTKRLKEETNISVSVLISPTILGLDDLKALKKSGADKIGIAVDLATPELFELYRGKGVAGPHKWEKYWQTAVNGLEIFGKRNVGIHLMVGMGETEAEMVSTIEKAWNMGAASHLFSFFAEPGSSLENRKQPPWPTYLRIQLARYLLEEEIISASSMKFDEDGHIIDFGLTHGDIMEIMDLGTPFMTCGCIDEDGMVACNRPFGNCLPGEKQWNYPYPPDKEELDLIKNNIFSIKPD
ncbi:MAG TPA: radical SAM protein [Desulfatiglandales bacterium]|nr:radical SAM protein [Desulfatiglandales bacterium]